MRGPESSGTDTGLLVAQANDMVAIWNSNGTYPGMCRPKRENRGLSGETVFTGGSKRGDIDTGIMRRCHFKSVD